MGGPQGLKEYKKSRERQQTAGMGGGVSAGAITNTLSPQRVCRDDVELDNTIVQVKSSTVAIIRCQWHCYRVLPQNS